VKPDHFVLNAEPAMFTMNTRCFAGPDPIDQDPQKIPPDDVSIAQDGDGDPDDADTVDDAHDPHPPRAA
jgi:hypothetical protein